MQERNDIVIYQSEDGLVRMEAMVDPVNETIWATQKAIASLFACTKQNVSYHMGKIFASGELDCAAVVKEILTTAQSGARGLSEDKVLYYNLDAIISVGYKINSVQATKFRIWSTSVIKEYMRHGYVINRNAVSMVHAEQWHPLSAGRDKAHLRCLSRGSYADDRRKPHGRNGYDGESSGESD